MNRRRVRRRLGKAVRFWDSRLDEILRSIAHSGDRFEARFKWAQLVWQEIWMFINLDKPVADGELRWINRRRGFTRHQRRFLDQALRHVGLR